MKCLYCQCPLKLKKVTYNINRQEYDVILHEVPALVCQACGEILYAEKSVALIQKMIANLDEKTEEVRSFTPRFKFATA